MNIVTVIQARTTSTRLAHKMLLPLADKNVLIMMTQRVLRAKLAGTVVVATTTELADDPIAEICIDEKLYYYRGHPYDLLDRHYKTGVEFGADVVVKIPSDCPLIDPDVIDRVIGFYIDNAGKYDFVSNLHPATYPDGNDVEVIPMGTLRAAWLEAKKDFEREHTTPFIWENPERFRIGNAEWECGLDYSMRYRWTIDYFEDYKFIREVYKELYRDNPAFGMYDILRLLNEKPHIADINSDLNGVNWYRNYLSELKTIKSSQTKVLA